MLGFLLPYRPCGQKGLTAKIRNDIMVVEIEIES